MNDNTSNRPRIIAETLASLAPGEQIAWEGRGKWGRYLASEIRNNITAIIILTPIAYFLQSALVYLIAIGIIFITFWADRVKWKNSYYVITNRRVIIQSAGLIRKEIKSTFYREMTGAFLKIGILDRIMGTGTIKLMFQNLNPFVLGRAILSGQHTSHSARAAALNELRHIPNVGKVHGIIQNMIQMGAADQNVPMSFMQNQHQFTPSPTAGLNQYCSSCGNPINGRFCQKCGAQN
jgi:hypothetical protein